METTKKKKVIDLPYFIKKISNGNNKEKKKKFRVILRLICGL